MYANCLLFALYYRLTHAGTRLRVRWGTWWCFPHCHVLDADQVVDFQSWPPRNGTPLLFRGRVRVRSLAAYEALPDAPSPWAHFVYHFRAWQRYHRLLDRLDRAIRYEVFMHHWHRAGQLCTRRERVKRLYYAPTLSPSAP